MFGITPLKDVKTCAEAMKEAGADFTTEVRELYNKDGKESRYKSIVRTDTGVELGVCGRVFKPLQNTVKFNWFDPWIQAKELELVGAGVLNGGKKVFIQAELNPSKYRSSEIVKGDLIRKFVLFADGNGGLDNGLSIHTGFTPHRVWCENTLSLAIRSEASKLLRIRHSIQAEKNLEKVRDIVNLANQEFEATAEQYRFLASRHVNQKDVRKYVKLVLGVTDADNDMKTRTRNLVEKIEGLIDSGKGNTNSNVKGTWWACYNGVTEWLSHQRGKDENRLNALWFGQSNQLNKKAFDIVMALAA